MRINPHYVSKEKNEYQIDRAYNTKRPVIKPYYKDGYPTIKFGLPQDIELQKKELIKEIVIDPQKREQAIKAAELEQKAGVKEMPITNALIKTTGAYQNAMAASSIKESQAIADATAEQVVKEDKKITFNKLFNNSAFTLIVGVVLTIVVFKYLIKS